MSLIRRAEEREYSDLPARQNGPGHMESYKLAFSDEEMLNKGRMFNENILNKDCGVGYHVHEGDGEIYYILSGEAEYNDNGTVTTIRKGDVTFTGPGEGHSITNLKDEPVHFLALILYE